ncbi:MAG: type I DNA topoisomerase [Peptococcaceae bacterium]|nr:type I DNA topoisomerase [Peptococcaceae bacterium]
MGKTLVVVESPAKAKTIGKFLGKKYTVKACMGHVRDLPKSQFGIDMDKDIALKYITIRGKGDLVSELKSMAQKSDRVLLATDPDREGEAIAWHLGQLLQLDTKQDCRIEFNEITKKTVEESVKHPRPVDDHRVDAQQARRVLDRIVGYKLSPLLWRKVRKGLSAGRVQSVALRLICDREKEIQSFVPEEYWDLKAQLSLNKDKFFAKLIKEKNQKVRLESAKDVERIKSAAGSGPFIVGEVNTKTQSRNPAPPFTTSSLQQEAFRKINFTAKRTMLVAQQLYEGLDLSKEEGTVGLISYIRTDSTRISEEAQQEARNYILESFGKEYYPKSPRVYVKKGKIQDSHEGIRPSSVYRTPESVKAYLTGDQYKLYKLIWERFMASQMASLAQNVTTVDLTAGDFTFRSTGVVVTFPGFTRLYDEGRDESRNEEEEDDNTARLPYLKKGDEPEWKKYVEKQHFTQPQPRFTEASLIKTLEEMGIGRPSTYAPTIDTIVTRGYVLKEKKQFKATELGDAVVDLLKEYFPNIIDKDFTARMENQLDEVEEGQIQWKSIVYEFYEPFIKELEVADEKIGHVELTDEVTDEVCPQCGRNLVIKHGRFGKFLACPGFPQCRYTKPLLLTLELKCPKCGKGDVVIRQTKKKKKFYGCSNYPECDYTSWYEPVATLCPVCGQHLVKRPSGSGTRLACPTEGCSFKPSMLKEEADKAQAPQQEEKE